MLNVDGTGLLATDTETAKVGPKDGWYDFPSALQAR